MSESCHQRRRHSGTEAAATATFTAVASGGVGGGGGAPSSCWRCRLGLAARRNPLLLRIRGGCLGRLIAVVKGGAGVDDDERLPPAG